VIICGVDEAGVGCLAGPMVIVAAAFDTDAAFPELVRDSKKLKEHQRESLIDEIYGLAEWVMIKVVTSLKINLSDNIWTAWTEVMGEILIYAKERADKVIVDGNRMVFPHKEVHYIVKADDKHREVSAASIVAKYVQTEAMVDLHNMYPAYGFRQHHGYGTAVHNRSLKEFGPTPHHRAGYGPVKKLLTPGIRLQMMQGDLFESPVTTKVLDRRS
jgi:ribonuclease HII